MDQENGELKGKIEPQKTNEPDKETEYLKLKKEKSLLEERLKKSEEKLSFLEETQPNDILSTAGELAKIKEDIKHFELEDRDLKIHEKDSVFERQRKVASVIIKEMKLTYKLPTSDSSMPDHYENVVNLAKEKLISQKEKEDKGSSNIKIQNLTRAMRAFDLKMVGAK